MHNDYYDAASPVACALLALDRETALSLHTRRDDATSHPKLIESVALPGE